MHLVFVLSGKFYKLKFKHVKLFILRPKYLLNYCKLMETIISMALLLYLKYWKLVDCQYI